MLAATAEDVPQFDFSDATLSVKSRAIHDAREQNWYAKTNYGLVALRYDEVKAMLRNPRLRQGVYAWLEQNGITEGLLAEWWALNPISQHGDDHRRMRRLLNPLMTPNAIDPMAPGFERLAHELIDVFADRGECEFVADFANPFSARVLLQLLGLPEDDWARLAGLANDMGDAFGVDVARELPRIEAALAELYVIADEVIALRRKSPGEDVVSRLVAARDGDDKLSEAELRMLITTFIFGGMDTTRNQVGLALHTFMQHPSQWALLGERPELGAAAVEEAMRVNPSVLWITREAVEDITVGGLDIPAGTTVHLLTESAGTDPRVGGDAEFDITADRARQLGFGAGPHHCVGHYLSRCDMREALPILAQRLRNPTFVSEPTFRPDSGVTGPITMPIRFDHSPRQEVTQ